MSIKQEQELTEEELRSIDDYDRRESGEGGNENENMSKLREEKRS